MPQLANPKWEFFCINLTKKQFIGTAYLNAGYKAKNADVASAAGNRLLKNVKINARYQELLSEALEKEKITAEEVIGILAKIARNKPANIVSNMSDSGFEFKDISEWPEESLVALEGVETRVHADGVSVPVVKFASKSKAAEILLSHFDKIKELDSGRSQPPSVLLNVSAEDLKGKNAQNIVQMYQALLGGKMKGSGTKKK